MINIGAGKHTKRQPGQFCYADHCTHGLPAYKQVVSIFLFLGGVQWGTSTLPALLLDASAWQRVVETFAVQLGLPEASLPVVLSPACCSPSFHSKGVQIPSHTWALVPGGMDIQQHWKAGFAAPSLGTGQKQPPCSVGTTLIGLNPMRRVSQGRGAVFLHNSATNGDDIQTLSYPPCKESSPNPPPIPVDGVRAPSPQSMPGPEETIQVGWEMSEIMPLGAGQTVGSLPKPALELEQIDLNRLD